MKKIIALLLLSIFAFGQKKEFTLKEKTIEGFKVEHILSIKNNDSTDRVIISYRNPSYKYANDLAVILIYFEEDLNEFIYQINNSIKELKLKEKSNVYFHPNKGIASYYLVKYKFDLSKIYIFSKSDYKDDIGKPISLLGIEKMKVFLENVKLKGSD